MFFKKVASTTLAVLLTLALCQGVLASAPTIADTARIQMPSISVPCRNAILVSGDTGQVMFEKDADVQVPIASITKVMTLLLTFEAIESKKLSLTDKVPVSTHAYEMGGSQIWLEPGEDFTLEEMIKAICVSSANDAAVAVAELVGGSEPAFADMMNKRALELGMTSTTFKNACGLDEEGHLSTARDVAIMSRELLKHEIVFKYSTIWMDSLRGGQTQLVNTNKLLKNYEGINGLKTGTTGKAGVCISASAERENMLLIAVVLGSDSAKERFSSATQLLDYGFATYEVAAFPSVEGAIEQLPVSLGAQKQAALEQITPQKLLLQKGEGAKLSAVAVLPKKLSAPLEQGAQVGEITLLLEGKELAKYPICAKTAVSKMDFATGLRLLLSALVSL